jgi:hypothetical protein
MEDEVLERNKNLNRGFRKLNVWREAIDLYVFEKKVLGYIIRDTAGGLSRNTFSL